MAGAGHMSPKEGKKFAKAITRISDHIEEVVGGVKILLTNRGRITAQYYHIVGVRPYRKGEYYLDGSNHIANIAEEDGEPHWVEIILRPDRFD